MAPAAPVPVSTTTNPNGILGKATLFPFHVCNLSDSKVRKVFPQKRSAFPLRFRFAALNGTQPKERRRPRLRRQRNFLS